MEKSVQLSYAKRYLVFINTELITGENLKKKKESINKLAGKYHAILEINLKKTNVALYFKIDFNNSDDRTRFFIHLDSNKINYSTSIKLNANNSNSIFQDRSNEL